MNDRRRIEDAIFLSALDLPEPVARQEFLDRACAGDASLRAAVEALLADHESAKHFFDQSQAAFRGASEDLRGESTEAVVLDAVVADEQVGKRIGPYKILERLGEGGWGVVYMAEQEKPIRRRVALKIIKLGMDTKVVIARFEAERQALALMDHANIAQVFDAGTTATGRPYFVMELVRGTKITDYCDQSDLGMRERLELFIEVCHAIQHAHQKGVIHRDIKPSNILVTMHDGVPVPKVIDFGIAKAIEGKLTEQTLFTAYAQVIGTPAYMSPEQAELSGLDVDTRSDIYSLGVLLYELLTGRTPFDGQELIKGGVDEMRRTLREDEPLRPSGVLTALHGTE
ncbi:MAG TPA: serine/threonine-protein kinase, partial [Verrucomicrobiae bacterium]